MSDQFIGRTLAGKYRVDSLLRESASSSIYNGTHLLINKPVTIKILAPALTSEATAVKNFSVETRAASRIAHPNVLNVTDFGLDIGGTVYAILEDASGETLTEAIERSGKFSLDRAVGVAWQIASALSAAHAARVVHGHLNTENVLLAHAADNSETVKVLDFGTAEAENRAAFETETDLKNLQYLSPEQNASETPDERSDIYSVGVILYEMMAGEVPFQADTPDALRLKQTENPPTPLAAFQSDLPEDIELVALKALAVNPEMRYQTASEFADALSRASNNAGGAKAILIKDAADANGAKNNLWKTAFVVLAGISLLAASLIYATSVKQTNIQTQLQTDAGGQPVQPINPATGMSEQSLSSMSPYSQQMGGAAGMMPGGANMSMPQPVSGGDGYGDGYNPWASGRPPAGAPPQYVAPNGQVITIPGDGSSQFMPVEGGGFIMVPANTNTTTQPSPSPKTGKSPAAAAAPSAANTAQPTPTPNAQATPEAKATPTPAPKADKTPAKPAATPKTAAPKTTTPPAPTGKISPSGKDENS
jgi:serine/threonine protein kinase